MLSITFFKYYKKQKIKVGVGLAHHTPTYRANEKIVIS